MRKKRLLQSLRLAITKSSVKKGEYIRSRRIFALFGEGSNYCPLMLPVYPELIRIHDNVYIHRSARLIPHDMINRSLKTAYPDCDFGHRERLGCIEIDDNVYVSMRVIILPNVRIGKNCIITAGSIVTNDIPDNSIVAGNPAKVVGKYDQYVALRLMNKDENEPFVNQKLPQELALRKWNQFDSDHSFSINQDVENENNDDNLTDIGLEIKNQIINVLSSQIDGVDLKTEKHLIDHHILDSLGMMTVVTSLEEEFDCRIPFDRINAKNFNSVLSIAKLITELSLDNTQVNTQKSPKRIATSLTHIVLDKSDTEKTVVQRIFEYALKRPKDIAIIANDKETTYLELSQMIYSISDWLRTVIGKSTDCCIVVQAIHEDICIATYYAVHLYGAKLVPVEKTATKERILAIAHDIEAALIIGLENNEESSTTWVNYETVRDISHSVVYNSETSITYPEIDSPCEMVFTTGTTGKSKGVLMTHRHISWYCYSVGKCIEMKAGNRFLLTTPLNHAGGLRRTHLSLANGCCMVYLDGLSDLSKYFEYIQKYNVTSLYLPPVALRIILSRTGDELGKYKNQIDFVYSSSSSLPVVDCMDLCRLLPNTRLYNAYEASETPGVSAYNYNVEHPLKNCLGQANEGVEIAVLHEDGTISEQSGVQGQICVKSNMNMEGYYKEPELSASVFKDGWFVSNDLGYLDEYGNIYYNGRKGDVINIGGYKIAPTDVEEVALASGLINECICIEDYDKYQVPFLKLLVVIDSTDTFDAKELISYISSKLEAYKIPRKIECVDSITKTYNGKIDRKAYRIERQ